MTMARPFNHSGLSQMLAGDAGVGRPAPARLKHSGATSRPAPSGPCTKGFLETYLFRLTTVG
ncbi:hypothetical protein GSI_10107 [Ganoderma sinense ZZ0214-1]|uniref:Uncharacterized protein n=1 Tax=Ganoderma sinense ZZ0214-1 TaxID=1077348 RepID=A0A2G8RZM1_9APHY|nr:hypothetical protein GSI_10107 [Ganoderma sinense ZZ0214-1]